MSTCKTEMRFRVRSASWPDIVLLAVLSALVLLAWWVLWMWGSSPHGHVLMHGSAHPSSAHPGMAADNLLQFALAFIGGWTLMTVAMMLPTSFPLLVLFQRMLRGRRAATWLLAVVILGYLAVWASVGVGLQALNWLLQATAERITWRPDAPRLAATAILCIAGLYQFSKLKYACLEKCRSPLSFLAGHWQGKAEWRQALRLGATHGLFCVGCCWSLMLLMFVVGAGSLGAMLVLGVLMALEKNFSWGRRLSAPLGFLLLAGAAAMLLAGFLQA
jgi:predicted metal-binding membrane protein